MRKESPRAPWVSELVAILVTQSGAFIIVVARRALGIADQHALTGQDEIHPRVLRFEGRLHGRCLNLLSMGHHGTDRIGMVNNIVRHV